MNSPITSVASHATQEFALAHDADRDAHIPPFVAGEAYPPSLDAPHDSHARFARAADEGGPIAITYEDGSCEIVDTRGRSSGSRSQAATGVGFAADQAAGTAATRSFTY